MNFRYNDISGKLFIKNIDPLNNKRMIVEFNGRSSSINKNNILSGIFLNLIINPKLIQQYSIGDVIKTKRSPFKLKIINYGVRTNNGKEEIIYTCMCLNCGKIFQRSQNVLKEHGCPYRCLSVENITQSAPWMISYFQGGYDEAKMYTKTSKEKICPKCPICGRIQETPIRISTLYQNGMKCICNRNISFPERFICNILDQLQIHYIFQPTTKQLEFEDSNKRYDFYVPDFSMIIEVHGEQHYKKVKRWVRSYNQQEKDENKKQIALSNGIKNYIEIDCRNSTIKWIKNSVMNSSLPSLFSFKEEDINWLECAHYNKESIIKLICDDYTNNYLTIKQLCEKYNLGKTSIARYLKIGNEYGWCIFNKQINTNFCPIEVLKDGTHVAYFKSIADAERRSKSIIGTKLIANHVIFAMNGKWSHYLDYTYKKVEDNQLKWKILKEEIC